MSCRKAKYLVRERDSIQVEPHADVVETTGHVHVKTNKSEYHIWYVRVYAKREGRWQCGLPSVSDLPTIREFAGNVL